MESNKTIHSSVYERSSRIMIMNHNYYNHIFIVDSQYLGNLKLIFLGQHIE
jgi:hypothetical protein